MNDVLIKAIGYQKNVRIYAVSTTNALNTIGDRLNYYPSALDALGRVLSMGAMMGGGLKRDETVTLKLETTGPIGKIIVDADAHGNIRGYSDNPHCHFQYADGRLNVKATIVGGVINVIKDLKLKEPFVGYSPIISGEVAEDFAYYYSISEQIPTAISLGVLVDTEGRAVASGGFMVQLMPNTSDEIAATLEKVVKELPPISEMLSSGYTPLDLVNNLAKDAEVLDTVNLEFKCTCSKERFANGILTLGSEEIKDIIDKDGEATTTCHFCGNTYHFNKEELTNLYMIDKERGK